ncbi:MAG: hypothetical protein J07HN4v3_00303 [Halonotius sp. J07HN4]|nr:MAG: hypothetical protein J07HN4v3_00303 [Halonotius sp. J07HN4]
MAGRPSPKNTDQLYALSNRGEYGKLIQYIRSHNNEHVRFGAAGVLSESIEEFTEKVTPRLQQALVESVLNDPSDDVRATVLRVLLALDESTIDTIITRLEADPQSTPTGTPYPLILTKWHGKPRAPLRFLAVAGFGRVESRNTIEKLRTTIIREENMRVLRRAIEEGGDVGDERFVTPIQEHLRMDNEKYEGTSKSGLVDQVQQAAVEALVKIGSSGAYEALLSASRSANEALKEQVISEIGKFGAQDTVDVVVDKLDTDDNDALRREAASGVITSFTESTFEESHSVRQRTIEKIDDEISTDVSAEFAGIVSEAPRNAEKRNAAWLLGQLESETDIAVDSLLDALADDDKYLRTIATASLTNIDHAELEQKVDAVLETADEESDAHALASFLKTHLHNDAEAAKKELVDYRYVSEPSDYTVSGR